jgi:GH15 family glucan-1,4-alpha-glucosidase
VRVGNAAVDQLQLDVYGEILDAAAQFVARGGSLDRETRRLLCGFGDYVSRNWERADEGIWEPRSGRRHNTHSRLLCWVAMERLCDLHGKMHLPADHVADYARARQRIAASIREQAWSAPLGSYVSTLGGSALDASTLLLSWYGFEDAASERMRRSYARLMRDLGAGRGLLNRYRNGESPGEGAFGVCGFWGAEYLALGGGSIEDAAAALEQLLAFQNDVGLLGEEIDPASGAALGNFPQAFTHIGLINAALSLQQRIEGQAAVPRELPPRPAAPAPGRALL